MKYTIVCDTSIQIARRLDGYQGLVDVTLTLDSLYCLMAVCSFLDRATWGTWNLRSDAQDEDDLFRLSNGRDHAAVSLLRLVDQPARDAVRSAAMPLVQQRTALLQLLVLDNGSGELTAELARLALRAAGVESLRNVDAVLLVTGDRVRRIWPTLSREG